MWSFSNEHCFHLICVKVNATACPRKIQRRWKKSEGMIWEIKGEAERLRRTIAIENVRDWNEMKEK
jgi:hypothetical protein